ncbi:hypothetical protein V8E53_006007, partial [Lactarius tabidus]
MSSSANLTTSPSLGGPATEDIPHSQSPSSTLPTPVSDLEAKYYYTGLPSAPILVARTSTTPWEMPTGPEAYRKGKELRTVFNPTLSEAMQGDMSSKLFAVLDSMEVKWTCIDVFRIGYPEDFFPTILWIGVVPASLSRSDGAVAAFKCREVLVENGFTDIDVEIREAVV